MLVTTTPTVQRYPDTQSPPVPCRATLAAVNMFHDTAAGIAPVARRRAAS